MKPKTLSLQGRLRRLSSGEAAHPEYDGAIIRRMARVPIARYIGDSNAFCYLQSIIEIGEATTYQEAAKAISNAPYSPENVSQIVSLLAAPVVKIEEAFRQHDKNLLPRYYAPRQIVPTQECLAVRLESTGTVAGPPYACACMPIQRYVRAVSDLTGDPGFLDIYNGIQPHMSEDHALLREVAYNLYYYLQEPERTKLLYHIFVGPFAKLQKEREAPHDHAAYYQRNL